MSRRSSGAFASFDKPGRVESDGVQSRSATGKLSLHPRLERHVDREKDVPVHALGEHDVRARVDPLASSRRRDRTDGNATRDHRACMPPRRRGDGSRFMGGTRGDRRALCHGGGDARRHRRCGASRTSPRSLRRDDLGRVWRSRREALPARSHGSRSASHVSHRPARDARAHARRPRQKRQTGRRGRGALESLSDWKTS